MFFILRASNEQLLDAKANADRIRRDLILQLLSKTIMSVNVEAIHSRFIIHTALLPTHGLLMRHPSRNPINGWGTHILYDDLSRSLPPIGATDFNPAWL